MEDQTNTAPDQKDPLLWAVARKRASFKKNLASYIIVNAFLWVLYYFTRPDGDMFPWPLWSLFGWGIGLAFQYFSAYVTIKNYSVEKEYDKLVRKGEK